MKKSLLLLTLLPAFYICRAQVDKGTYLNAQDLTLSYAQYHTFGFVEQTVFGWAVKKNLVVGLDTYIGNWGTFRGPLNTGESKDGGGLFVRKYYYLARRWSAFGAARLGYGYDYFANHHAATYAPYHESANGYVFNLTVFPGLAFNVNSWFQLELTLPNLLSANDGHAAEYNFLPPDTHLNPHQYTNGFNVTSSLTQSPLDFAVGVVIMWSLPVKTDNR
jgi:hypothetical protein